MTDPILLLTINDILHTRYLLMIVNQKLTSECSFFDILDRKSGLLQISTSNILDRAVPVNKTSVPEIGRPSFPVKLNGTMVTSGPVN